MVPGESPGDPSDCWVTRVRRSPPSQGGLCCWHVPAHRARILSRLQIDYYCRLDCLWKKKFKREHEEFETMESVNRLLLENVLPAHVAAHFIGDKLNEVRPGRPREG